jgi:ATP-dependent Lon protease
MGREFVRISLGGVRDEAEIRGHRRTYVGAMPGRILQGLKQAGTNNPVFMLDEIDKLGADYRGDPSSALLEVLDPEQNHHFSDHYLNVRFDLSRVLFVATANLLDTIPGPLRDRMEVIRIAGYTPEEKVEIARSYLIPHQLREHGLAAERLRWTRGSVLELITDYTQEAGVRGLERRVAAVCRKVARRAAEGEDAPVVVNRKTLERLLGPPPFLLDKPEGPGEVGVANGLAWTESGGEVLTLEATMTPGSGLVLTGQIGDVMRSRARPRSRGRAGAAPSSASTPRCSAATRCTCTCRPARSRRTDRRRGSRSPRRSSRSRRGSGSQRRRDDRRGHAARRVLPVGGVREKALAALRAGIRPRDPAAQEPPGPARHPARPEEEDHVHPGRPHGRGARRRARPHRPVPRSRRASRPHTSRQIATAKAR